ncbi:ATP-grasp domain-containing protein [Lysobacter sp. ISL-50]|uniref:ATP-grasp domain-containing protein n=1 Tax=unclassified Lysobacter TaxID=2635362 RepID=UPI001BE685EF|nr:ATP-grasp domain-containing protein [Lysobacter sp. ISL-42]MBT2751306.1 ATP-grasp domain-containing protein [Lysobacter sp. ISL-50]MBT2776510.1 ATP-grasp domain-containing protein [Lysobacter sp. ISL-54]MBT2781005.1 ATP-grasp domain-containing protein [Lysobacter sp. ISL-52]
MMDVAQTDDGFKVIEFNTFNSSGFYAHDIGKIVAAVTAHFTARPFGAQRD